MTDTEQTTTQSDDYVDPLTGEVIESDWEDLSPEVFKFEKPGDSIEGTYLGLSEQELDGDLVNRHDMETPDGARFFWGSTTVDGSLRNVSLGNYIRLVFSGYSDKVYKGGNKAKLFKVYRRKTF